LCIELGCYSINRLFQVRRARKMAQDYQLMYEEPIPIAQLVQRVAVVMQEYTQSGGVRPFGVSLLLAGWDEDETGKPGSGKPYLFQVKIAYILCFLKDSYIMYVYN